MSVNVYDPVNDKLIPVAGATLYADTPIGAIQAFDAEEVPAGWLIFNGQTVLRSDYPDLWARANRNNQVGVGKFYGIGDGSTTFTLADLRETSLKGYGETSRSVGAHVKSGGLGVGEFIDDRFQDHSHMINKVGSGGPYYGITVSSADDLDYAEGGGLMKVSDQRDFRYGSTTEVKAVGVVWAVKAKQTGLPIDLKEQVRKQMFPDYAHLISIPNGVSWTATQDCYLQVLYITTNTTIDPNSRCITIDGDVVGISDTTGGLAVRQFSGYVKKGQVVSSYDGTLNLGYATYVKAFPLSS